MYARRSYKPKPYVVRYVRKRDMSAHRSTSWKVAYADFVTAMMAFFLLLWLYASLGSQQKTDIADYFTPTAGVVGKSGSGADGGRDERTTEGRANAAMGEDGLVKAHLKQGPIAAKHADVRDADEDADNLSLGSGGVPASGEHGDPEAAFMAVSRELKALMQKDDVQASSPNVLMIRNRDSLTIHIINDPAQPVFIPKNATLTSHGIRQFEGLGRIIAASGRALQIDSHTATGNMTLDPQYTQWELSADRAKATRMMLMKEGVAGHCITQMASHADHSPMIANEPANPRNNRVTLTLMRIGCGQEK